MNFNTVLQCALFIGVLVALVKPLGLYMARVFEGQTPVFMRWLGPVERLVYKLTGVKSDEEMTWKTYTFAMLLFNLVGILIVYTLQRVQGFLPLNPMGMAAVTPDSSFNTAISFGTNTNWQGYGGESTMSYLTQMTGLGVQNFLSAATGMAILLPLIRGFTKKESGTVGNFWTDLTRSVVYVLLPLSAILAIVLVTQGVVQTFGPSAIAHLMQPITGADGKAVLDQTIAVGPAASQIAIKQLGTNGGGFFNVNSAHPFENANALTNFLEVISILMISAALCFTFGAMVKDRKQGWALLAAMLIVFIPMMLLAVRFEQGGNPLFSNEVTQVATNMQSGGNMEGKEVRFGIANSAIWATATTAASNGSVNSMHDSYTPMGGLIPMFMMMFSEVIFGGVGCGLYGMLIYAVVAVFIAGLMVGRTPEYLGKKIESYEMKMAAIGILVPCAIILVGTAIAVVTKVAVASIANPGIHGYSEILYAFASAGNNNGSAFAGLSANVPFYNTALGICMFFSRYWIAVPVLALAGSLARKKSVPASLGTLQTHTPLFILFLVGTVVLVGALTFIPAVALGPIAEHFTGFVK